MQNWILRLRHASLEILMFDVFIDSYKLIIIDIEL